MDSAPSPPSFLLAWVQQEPTGRCQCLKFSSFWRQDLFPPTVCSSSLSYHSAKHGPAAEAFGKGNLWAATPGGIHPARISAPLWEHLPRALCSQTPTASLFPCASSASLGENHLFIDILAAFSTFRQPTSLPP